VGDWYRQAAFLILALLTLFGIVVSQYFLSSGIWETRRFTSQNELIESQPGGLTPERLHLIGLHLDLNSATVEDLSKVKGIGPRLAPEVIKLRDKIGKFKSVDELIKVRGMGAKRLESARKYLTVQPAPPDLRALEGVYSLLGMGPVLLPRSYEPIVSLQLEPSQIRPASGVRQALAILVNFSDTAALTTTTSEYFQGLLFSTGTGPYPYSSLNDFYQGMSSMSLTITGEVAGWFAASGSHDYYSLFGAPCADGPGYGLCGGAVKLVGEAITLAESSGENFNWVKKDKNNIAQDFSLFVVHQGIGAEQSFTETDIWSHSRQVFIPTTSGLIITRAIVVPEQTLFPTFLTEPTMTGPIDMGVFAHEMGHELGLPDLYDTDLSSYGIGKYCLMSYGYSGPFPSILSAWPRMRLGWARVDTPEESLCGHTFSPAEAGSRLLRAWPTGDPGKEYFLMEYRENAGIYIWHVDEARTDNNCEWCEGYCGAGHCAGMGHFLVALEQSDGRFDLEKMSNPGDEFDPYVYPMEFGSGTLPSSRLYSNTDSGIEVRVTGGTIGAVMMTDILLAPFTPSIVSKPITWARVGEPYTYQASAKGNGHSWYLSWYPAGMTINEETGFVSWTPQKIGEYYVEIDVFNCAGWSRQSFNVSVVYGGWEWSQDDCIASALTEGTPLEFVLEPLRGLRDRVLARTPLGRAFIRFYYRFSSLILH